MTLNNLKKGDIFKFRNLPWEYEHRFHSFGFYNDNDKAWSNEFTEGCRLCVNYCRYYGTVKNARISGFQWQSINNPLEIEVFIIKKFQISTSQKHNGHLFYESNGTREYYIPYEVNPINFI